MVNATNYMGNYLTAEMVEDTNEWAIIKVDEKEKEYQGDKFKKLEMTLENNGVRKILGLTVNNVKAMVELYGEETDDWASKRVIFGTSNMMVQGKNKKVVIVEVGETNKTIANFAKA